MKAVDKDDARLDFEVARAIRIERLYERAQKALDLASIFASESYRAGRHPAQDHRVIAAVRQVNEYRRAIARLRVMRFSDVDTVLIVAMSEEIAAA